MQNPSRLTVALLSGTVAFALQLDEEPKSFPVSKVVDLLKDMKKRLIDEADADEEAYEKMSCWCTTNDAEKTKSISDAEALLLTLDQTINKNAAASARHKVEIDGLEKELAAMQKALADATALREKETAEFTNEEQEMMEAIRALEAAVMVLGKHNGGAALLQESTEAKAAAASVEDQLRKHITILKGIVSPHQRRVLEAFIQQTKDEPRDQFAAKPAGSNAYDSQSGEIFGILRQMKETFESNLSGGQKEELDAQATFAALKAAKEEEMATTEGALEDKKSQLVNAETTLAQAKDELADTRETLKADKLYLQDLKLKCQDVDHEWGQRQKTRADEQKAVDEALAILTSDENRELFSSTFNPTSLLQASSRSKKQTSLREQAASVLFAAASKAADPKLSMLASSVRLDAFTRVKKAIDDMVAELMKEAEDEQKHQDFCVKELHENKASTAEKTHTKATTEARIEKIKGNIHKLTKNIETLEAEIADGQKAREQAKVDRDAENAEFEALVADQRKTQDLLGQVMQVLSMAFKTQAERHAAHDVMMAAGASLAQVHSHSQYEPPAGPPPPEGFGNYEKQRGANPVFALLEHIKDGARAMELEAIDAEDKAKIAYQDFVQQTQRTKEAKTASIIDRSQEKAQAEEDLSGAQTELSGTNDELQALAASLDELTTSCDWFLKNFDARSKARDEEVEALRQAKAFLSGAA
jgi:hypothetical protein